MNPERTPPSGRALAVLTLAAIGVVYGDIGTSPLYALKEVFAQGRVPLNGENILGILSLVFWTLTVVVSLKYVVLILRADNHGEGGIVALLAQHVLAHVPLAQHIKRVLDERGTHTAPASRFRDELEDHMSEQVADQTLRAVTSWARYGEIFAYDEASGVFSLDNPA